MAKKALGRGLHSLMPESTVDDAQEQIRTLPLSALRPNPDQPRKQFRDEQLRELAESIKQHGIIQPIIVNKQGFEYIIVAGERRFRAAKMAGLSEVPVIEQSISADKQLEIGLIENIQREDLSPIEEALAYRSLMDRFRYTQEDIAQRIGKSRPTIANSLRLLRLPDLVQQSLQEQKISAGHARTLLAIGSDFQEFLIPLFEMVIEQGLSVREMEAAVQKINNGQGLELDFGSFMDESELKNSSYRPIHKPKNPEISEMEELLRQKWGTRVAIKGSDSKGKIEIEYFSKDDLNRLHDLFLRDGTPASADSTSDASDNIDSDSLP